MKLSKVQTPKSKVQSDARTAHVRRGFRLWPLDFGPRDEDGIALVITLIMLAVITFMAITFLVLSQRERNSSTTAMDQKISQNAAETAMSRACAEVLADGLEYTNFLTQGLKVSTNFINRSGFVPGLNPQNPENVNYDYQTNGGAVNQNGTIWEENISSLEYNPRAPVFVVTNTGTGSNEFRFYVDLNRNGRFDTNGTWPVLSGNPLAPYFSGTNSTEEVALNYGGPILSNNFVGDPEWIGVLERPWQLHSADNKFTSRYAYLIVPAGNTLDVNYIHNRAKEITATGEGFYRNQGTGTYEVNLAAFLADLNVNMWGWSNSPNNTAYFYDTNANFASTGLAFANANDILSYRYGGPNANTYGTLNMPSQIFFGTGLPLIPDNIDLNARGPLMLGTSNIENFLPSFNWAGANNTNHLFSIDDFYDPTKVGASFAANLAILGTSNDSYNAYTFYRMLAQLGTDSATEKKINVNYKNTDANGNIVPGMETNLIPWTPADFFTNAADRMFRQLNLLDMHSNLITVTNIPIYENPSVFIANFGSNSVNYYTPAVQRVLQLAANIYDATTPRTIPGNPVNYPSVFRPVFLARKGVVSICGYVEVTNSADAFMPFISASNFVAQAPPNIPNPFWNIYGVPWIIGAKKGMPNFNQMSLANPMGIQRVLMFTNAPGKFGANPPVWVTNQNIQVGISNSFGVDVWNSYTTGYPRPLRLVVSNEVSMQLVNEYGITIVNYQNVPFGNVTNYPTGWPRWNGNANLSDTSFQIPLYSSLTNMFATGTYLGRAPWLAPLAPVQWLPVTLNPQPRFWMGLSFNFQYVLIDTSVNRIIDFVNIADTEPTLDVNTMFNGGLSGVANQTTEYDVWETNLVPNRVSSGVPQGIINQINVGAGQVPGYADWVDGNRTSEANKFENYLNNWVTNTFQDPYPAQATLWRLISWQANDPLVHYTKPDLTSTNGQGKQYNTNGVQFAGQPVPVGATLTNLGRLNAQYQPWGGNPNNPPQFNNASIDYSYQLKDPAMVRSDFWDFPTNKFWDIGLLGRVHRGTPWQTVYLKPFNPGAVNWIQWANDNVLTTNFFGNNRQTPFITIDGNLTQPNQDYQLFDLFTSTLGPNSSRGQLNVNQTNIAAWSAVLSGVNVLDSTASGSVFPDTIGPAEGNLASPLGQIWQGINNTRAVTNGNGFVFPNGVFQHEGDILNTPQLTVASPFINTNGLNPTTESATAGGVNDEVLERIPQQIMSLLTLNQSPRFVIYSYGQTLHPANNSLVTGGTFNGLCTNYQITAEIATRAVVRVDGSPDPQYTQARPDPQGRFYPPHIVVEQFDVLPPD